MSSTSLREPIGAGLTVTMKVAESLQSPFVAVTEYMVETFGFAIGLDMEVFDNPMAGVHW